MGEQFTLKAGDTSPRLGAILTDTDGSPIDLSETVVSIRLRQPRSDEIVLERRVEIVSPEDGHIRYDWGDDDTNDAGRYRIEFAVTYPNDSRETFPNDGYHDLLITQ